MAKYYATVAGLPNIGVEDRKLPFSSASLINELSAELTLRDKKLLDILRYEEENSFLIHYLEDEEKARAAEKQPSLISYDDVAAVLQSLKERKDLPKRHSLPTYMVDFLRATQVEPSESEREEQEEREAYMDEEELRSRSNPIHLKDRLSEYYYQYALQCGNAFIEDWSRFNMTLRNLFAAHIGRELGWDPADYVVGNSAIEIKLKTSKASNFGLDEEDLEGLSSINSILAEKDISRRERMIDVLKWEWLEERTFDHIFDIEALLCYYLKLRILERWTELNEKTGEATFRNIVAALKKESNNSLEEFKRNQKK